MSEHPSLSGMPPEIIQNIYFSLCDVQSVHNLALTSRQFRDSLDSPQYQGSKRKLEILETVVEKQYGPLPKLFQLATLETGQQPQLPRPVPAFTMELVKTLTSFGRIVENWADKYPQMRWRNSSNSDHRRELRPHERERFRRAMYCWWIYNRVFHSLTFSAISYQRHQAMDRDPRSIYLRQFRDHEIVEMCEVHDIVKGMLFDICPDNAKIQELYEESFPGKAPLYFGSYDTYRGQPSPPSDRKNHRQGMVAESWGDRAYRDWFVDNLMKLDLGRLHHFCYDLHDKRARKGYTDSLGEYFYDNPSSFRYKLQILADQRGLLVDMEGRGVGGGILWDSDTEDSNSTEDDDNEDEEPAGSRLHTGPPTWADGGSDSVPSDYDEPEDELDYQYGSYTSGNETPEGLEYEGEDPGGSDIDDLWAGGGRALVKGFHLY